MSLTCTKAGEIRRHRSSEQLIGPKRQRSSALAAMNALTRGWRSATASPEADLHRGWRVGDPEAAWGTVLPVAARAPQRHMRGRPSPPDLRGRESRSPSWCGRPQGTSRT